MKQQTAVDYLFNELIANPGNFIKAYKQAKEMEKQQQEISDEEIEKGAREWYDKEGRYKPSAIALKTWGYAIKWYREQLKQPKKRLIMTSVEWLEDKIQSDMTFMEILGLIRQAKEMEKEQIIDAYDAGLFDGSMDDVNDRIYKQYYNETFNKQ